LCFAILARLFFFTDAMENEAPIPKTIKKLRDSVEGKEEKVKRLANEKKAIAFP
jgi:hypothetical protein